jgi:hypothetical protein
MTSQATTAPRATNQNGVQLGPSREELSELERELELYLTFWAHVRDAGAPRSEPTRDEHA